MGNRTYARPVDASGRWVGGSGAFATGALGRAGVGRWLVSERAGGGIWVLWLWLVLVEVLGWTTKSS